MTPKEKAKELVDKYYWTFGDGYLGEQHIQCALILVNEILQDGMIEKAPFMANGKDLMKSNFIRYKDYWQQVKEEIENL